MHLFLTIVAFIVILSVLVLIHELGHYYFARRAGVRVDEFGFGLPPRLWGKKIGDTIYSINLFPFGGFVRLYGENAQEAGAITNQQSFNSKTLRERFSIVFAGVAMNLILAIFLLSFGFFFGIKPLLVDSSDILQAIEQHQLVVQPGFVIKDIDKGSVAERYALHSNDLIADVNGGAVLDPKAITQALEQADTKGILLRVRRGDSMVRVAIPKEQFNKKDKTLGVSFYDNFVLPRVGIQSVKANSDVARSGLAAGDIIIAVNDKPVYTLEDFQSTFLSFRSFTVQYQRDFKEYTTTVTFPQRKTIAVSGVMAGSPAEKAGFQKGDVIVQIQLKDVNSPDAAVKLLQQARDAKQSAQVLVERKSKLQTMYVAATSDGTYGIEISPIVNQNIDVVTSALSVPTSILELKPVSYSFFKSIGMGFKESYRLGKATVSMFGVLLSDIFTHFDVPAGVSGPVGIAQMTGTFVQEGFMSVIRFMALLSLSLAVLNLFPLPGLDGGRLLFIIIEAIIGRRVDQRVEQAIHAIGAILLILIILLVTYKDIVRLF
ncbi:MAG: site-2 protease family protein [Candidatus Gracilibacteria bacterium]